MSMRQQPVDNPVFVYGTLREGQSNRRVIEQAIREHRPASVDGLVLYGHGLPYPVATVSNRPAWERVVGEIVWLRRYVRDAALERLDLLEGFVAPGDGRNLFDRVTVTVDYADGGMAFQTRAWCYVANPRWRARLRASGTPIGSGDWLDGLPADPRPRCLVCGEAHDDPPLVLHRG